MELLNIQNNLEEIKNSQANLEEKWDVIRELFKNFILADVPENYNFSRAFYSFIEQFPENVQENLKSFFYATRKEENPYGELVEEALNLLENVITNRTNEISNFFVENYPLPEIRNEVRLIVKKLEEGTARNGHSYFVLFGYDEISGEFIKVYFWENNPLYYIKDIATRESLILLRNIQEYDEKSFNVKNDSLAVFEPDFLVNVSDIASCFYYNKNNKNNEQDYRRFFLYKLAPDEVNGNAIRGKLINSIFDSVIKEDFEIFDDDEDYQYLLEDFFYEALQKYPLETISSGTNENSFAENIEETRQEVENLHFPNMLDFIKRHYEQEFYDEIIEASFLAPRLGLQGRIDLIRSKDENTLEIIELKSGKVPGNHPWTDNAFQVKGYLAALQDIFPDKNIRAKVFYSKHTMERTSPMREVMVNNYDKQKLLKIRNEIVYAIYAIATKNYEVLEDIANIDMESLPRFLQRRLMFLENLLEAGPSRKNYYLELLSFILRELIVQKTGHLAEDRNIHVHEKGFSSLWLNKLYDKKKNFNIIDEMTLDAIDEEENKFVFNFDGERYQHAFRKGDLVILYHKQNDEDIPTNQIILRGTIREITQNQVIISFYSRQKKYEFLRQYNRWAIEPAELDRNIWASIKMLSSIIYADEKDLKLIQGIAKPEKENNNYDFDGSITEIQKDKITKALNAKNYFLLQGPPGTGKTSTFVVNYLQKAIKKSKPIVVLAFTNKAVEQIAKNLQEPRTGQTINYVRFGSKYTEDEFFFKSLTRQTQDYNKWLDSILQADIILSTITSFKTKFHLLQKHIPFDEVLVDEASQLTEAELVPVLLQFNKFVLTGDHNQLPAVIQQDEKFLQVNNGTLRNLGITNLGTSTFERLFENAKNKDWDFAIGQFQEHFRMHKDIAKTISKYYENPLLEQTPEQRETRTLHNAKYRNAPLGTTRLVFINHPHKSISKSNSVEAEIIANIVNQLVAEGYQSEALGIIVPFRAQIKEIRDRLNSEVRNEITIDSVERFQGDEKEIILFSTVAGNKNYLDRIISLREFNSRENPGEFVDRKLLVSVSRAKKQFIIVGNKQVLDRNEAEYKPYKDLIQYIQENGIIVGV